MILAQQHLTLVDSAAMATRVPADPYPFPCVGELRADNTALLIIDMQHDFCAEGGYMSRMGYDVGPLRRPIGPIGAALAAARAAGLHVLHTRQGYRADLADMTDVKRWRVARLGLDPESGEGAVLRRGMPGWQIIPELAPDPGEPIIDKTANGAFCGTDLDAILRAKGIRNVVFAGNTIDVCVHSTLREAGDRGYNCLLLADACGAADDGLHAAAVAMVKVEDGLLGTVSTAADFAAAIRDLS